MDLTALRSLLANPSSAAHIFVALNDATFLSRTHSLLHTRVHDLDWWDECILTVTLLAASSPAAEPIRANVRVTCAPAQYVSSRTPFDRWRTLRASRVVEELNPAHDDVGKRVYFGGDTEYRTVRDGEDEDAVPVCPAFKQVGERIGGVDRCAAAHRVRVAFNGCLETVC